MSSITTKSRKGITSRANRVNGDTVATLRETVTERIAGDFGGNRAAFVRHALAVNKGKRGYKNHNSADVSLHRLTTASNVGLTKDGYGFWKRAVDASGTVATEEPKAKATRKRKKKVATPITDSVEMTFAEIAEQTMSSEAPVVNPGISASILAVDDAWDLKALQIVDLLLAKFEETGDLAFLDRAETTIDKRKA